VKTLGLRGARLRGTWKCDERLGAAHGRMHHGFKVER